MNLIRYLQNYRFCFFFYYSEIPIVPLKRWDKDLVPSCVDVPIPSDSTFLAKMKTDRVIAATCAPEFFLISPFRHRHRDHRTSINVWFLYTGNTSKWSCTMVRFDYVAFVSVSMKGTPLRTNSQFRVATETHTVGQRFIFEPHQQFFRIVSITSEYQHVHQPILSRAFSYLHV